MPCPANELGNQWSSTAVERRTILYTNNILALVPTRAKIFMMENWIQKSAQSEAARDNSPRRIRGVSRRLSCAFGAMSVVSNRKYELLEPLLSYWKQTIATVSNRKFL